MDDNERKKLKEIISELARIEDICDCEGDTWQSGHLEFQIAKLKWLAGEKICPYGFEYEEEMKAWQTSF